MITQPYKAKLVALIALLLTLIPAPTLAAGEPRLVLAAETSGAAVGQEIMVKLLVEDVSPAVKVQTQMSFDPTALKVVAVNHGDFFTPNPETNAFVLQNHFDNAAGTIDYALLLKPNQPPAEGDGLVTTITFQALVEGATPIEIQDGHFFSAAGAEIVALTESTELTIGDEAAAEYASAVQSQPLPDQAESSVSNPPEVEANPIVQEQPVADQMGSATTNAEEGEVNPATPMIEPESPAEVTQPAPTGLRHFRIEPQSSFGNDQLLVLGLLVGLGGTILAAGFIGLVGVGVGWLWLMRIRRRRSRRLAPVQIIELEQNYPISLPPVPVRRIGPP